MAIKPGEKSRRHPRLLTGHAHRASTAVLENHQERTCHDDYRKRDHIQMKTLTTTGRIASGNLFVRGVVWRDILHKTTKTQHMDTITVTITIITLTTIAVTITNNPVTQVLPHH